MKYSLLFLFSLITVAIFIIMFNASVKQCRMTCDLMCNECVGFEFELAESVIMFGCLMSDWMFTE